MCPPSQPLPVRFAAVLPAGIPPHKPLGRSSGLELSYPNGGCGWKLRHQLDLRTGAYRVEIGLSKRTLSGDRVLTAEETDALLATFPKVDDPGYFLFLTDAGISKWKIENWDITESRAQAIMFAPHPGETEGDA